MLRVEEEEKQSFFEVLGEYILDGFKVAVVVAAMLIGFVAIIALINGIFNAVFGISFQGILDMCLLHSLFLSVSHGMKLLMLEALWQQKWYRMNLSP